MTRNTIQAVVALAALLICSDFASAQLNSTAPTQAPASATLQPMLDPSQAMNEAPASAEQIIQRLTARIEELEHRVMQLTQQLEAAHQTPSTQPESSAEEAAAPDTTPKKALTEQEAVAKAEQKLASSLPDGNIQEQYDHARQLLVSGQYVEAEKSFVAFVGLHSTHDLAANAYYWLGETYFIQQQFDKAIVTFAQGYKDYGQSPKAPDMLIKTVLCLEKLKKNDDACVMLDELKSAFPIVSQGITQAAQKARKRLKCAG